MAWKICVNVSPMRSVCCSGNKCVKRTSIEPQFARRLPHLNEVLNQIQHISDSACQACGQQSQHVAKEVSICLMCISE